jgi:uncharacterized protein (TIGR02246 family)
MTNHTTDESSFNEMIRDYLEAFNASDAARVASHWAEDGVHQPPMGPEIRGRAALEKFYRQSFEVMHAKLSDYTNEYLIEGDHVFVRENFTVTIQMPGEEPVSLPGKGLWIGRKEADGAWRTFWALARIDQPEPEPEST